MSISHEDDNFIEGLYEKRAKESIKKKAEESRLKGMTLFNMEDVEAELKRQEEERAREREEHYRKRPERVGEISRSRKKEEGEITVYKARAALNQHKIKPLRKESFIHRTFRLFKGLAAVRKEIRNGVFMTAEKKKKLRLSVFTDAWQPVTDFLSGALEDFWDFLGEIWRDFLDILLFCIDIFIKLSYYLMSLFLFLWDNLWDVRIWLDEHKKSVFQWFSGAVISAAVILIGISSLSGYEYSYYGRLLGITRSKQEVYQTIDALGDKLAEATGANINFDAERDIQFKKVYGFHLNIDDSDDILNTLTYMKDIQVRAYAVFVNGEQTVILENEDAANSLIERIRNAYAPEKDNVEYIQISYDQTITVEEVGAQLGDIWNADDAFRYLETGSIDGNTEEPSPVITMHTVEIATYTTDVNFGAKYIDNSSIYADETELISAGIKGKNTVVAEIKRINGIETARTVKSTKRTLNPVDAVYYQGTKPIPERTGTGTFIYPIKTYTITSRFGSRNTGIIGASTYHQGVDFGSSTGTKIYATDGGEVTFAGWQSGYGYVVIIDHGGLYESRYGHCSKIVVKKGDKVYQGQYIANVGNTGVSSGPHLHFEIRYKDVAFNPLTVLIK